MKVPCEIIVQEVLPALRSMLASKLIDEYDLTQLEAAKKLGITQAAVSQYKKNLRGNKVKTLDKDIQEKINKCARNLFLGELDLKSLSKLVCEICRDLKRRRKICELCNKCTGCL